MRYIETSGYCPKNFGRISIKRKHELQKFTDRPSRKSYIKDQPKDWNIVLGGLIRISNGKCWYSEALEAVSPLYIEHFRPKNRINLIKEISDYPEPRTSQCKDGYWWLSYDLSNFRVSGYDPNNEKGTYFPLIENSPICLSPHQNINFEKPFLLDPCKKEDIKLISFVGTTPEPTSPDPNTLDYKRAEFSIKIYDLKNPKLHKSRSLVLTTCQKHVEFAQKHWNKAMSFKDVDQNRFEDSIEAFADFAILITDFLNPRNMYTSMIKSYLNSLSYNWVEIWVLNKAKDLKYI